MFKKLSHVAIIMDGNGRWAQQRHRPRTYGHIKGARVAKKIITYASNNNLKHLTLYAFSSENWARPQDEVSFLMTLLQRYLKKESENLHKQNIKFNTIGDTERLPKDIQFAIESTRRLTENNTGLHLTFAISYGSRQEIVNGIKDIAEMYKSGQISLEQINESLVSKSLMNSEAPDPDLIIRTSGEQRLSNFLMWQAAYSELYFTETLWPDFEESDFAKACQDFYQRDRRFGRISSTKNEESLL